MIAGTVPWAVLLSENTKHLAAWPWAVPIMATYLWFYWRYFVRGWGWPRSNSAARRSNARANSLTGDIMGLALLAGLLGLVSILLLQGVLGRLVTLPQQRDLDISQYAISTVVLWVVMGALVAGIVEETSFRGYLQSPIERRYGPIVALFVTGVVFGLAHFSHPEVGLGLLPYYIAVAAVYGGLAYATNSTLPSMVLHAGGNMFSAVNLFAGGRSQWQLGTAPKPLIWQTGADVTFWGTLAALLVFGTLTWWAYRGLRAAARAAQQAGGAA